MSSLAVQLKTRIARVGPITIADYMAECLLHPTLGYYTNRDPLGATGDFITAPEISQMFGELIGLCLAQSWMDQGGPSPFILAELGPGRGTLMADAMRATANVPGFHDAAQIHLIEASPVLRDTQSKTIPDPTFHNDVGTLPDLPVFLIANEFFDALPIRQFIRAEGGWSERMVGLSGDTLTIGLSAAAPIELLDGRLNSTDIGDLVEHCPALPGFAQDIGQRIETHGGAALIIDYGHWAGTGDTFQSLKSHKMVDPMASPGNADLTAYVDFAAIANAAPCKATKMTPQGVFLERLGITPRAQSLAKNLREPALEQHIAAHRRLTHPDEMGDLFKVIGLYPTHGTPPPGLEP